MSFKNPLRFLVLCAALLVFGAASAYAQGTCANCTTTNANLTLSATAETAISLNITTGSGGSTITNGGSGAFTVSFGNVDGLGISTPGSDISVATSGSGATWTTPIPVTPSFSGFSGTTATVKVYQDSTTSAASQSAARGGAAAGSVTTIPTSQAAALTISNPANNGSGTVTLTRYVGVFVSNANGASRVTGALAPKFIYLFTAQ